MDVPPVVRRCVSGIDAECLHGVDRGQRPLYLSPAVDAQQDLAAGTNERHRLERFAASDGAQDVETRNDGAVVVGGPTDKGEDALGCEADDAAAAVDDLFVALAAETYPVFHLLLLEGQFDQCGEGRWPVRSRTAMCRTRCHAGHG